MDRETAWTKASELIAPIIEQHGLNPVSGGSNFLATSGPLTAVDQHINHILTVAEWLLEDDANQ